MVNDCGNFLDNWLMTVVTSRTITVWSMIQHKTANLKGDLIKVESVTHVVVSADSFRVVVDHHGFPPHLFDTTTVTSENQLNHHLHHIKQRILIHNDMAPHLPHSIQV